MVRQRTRQIAACGLESHAEQLQAAQACCLQGFYHVHGVLKPRGQQAGHVGQVGGLTGTCGRRVQYPEAEQQSQLSHIGGQQALM